MNEEKLIEGIKTILVCLTSESQRIYSSKVGMGRMNDLLDDELIRRLNQIHELYKKYTYLKGKEELPKKTNVYFAEVANAMDILGFKSTEEWKK